VNPSERPGSLDDGALALAAGRGDRDAMEALLERHYDRMAAIAARMLGRGADAEDATQNALLAVVRGISRFDGRSAVTTWIHRVTVNACLDEIRRRGRRDRPIDPHDPTSDLVGHVEGVAPDTAGPDGVADHVDIEAALARLPVEFRAAVVLRDLCGLDYAEIAECLEIPAGTARSRISRGRRMLGEILGNPLAPSDVQGTDR
jgi:RNA polymerase sigma-70 factor (ECF subfamily)